MKWPYDPSYENAIATLAAILFLTAASVSAAAAEQIIGRLPWGVLAFSVVVYVGYFVALPLKESRALEEQHPAWGLADGGILLRRSSNQATKAVDLYIRRFVIFNENDLNPAYDNWKSLFFHEFSHIENGDSLFFHFAGASGFMLIGQVLTWIVLWPIGLIFDDPNTVTEDAIIATVVLVVLFPTQVALLAVWIMRSIHRREYNADAFAHSQASESYGSWMTRQVRRSALRSTSGRRITLKYLASIPSRITHPEINGRSRLLLDGQRSLTISPWRSAVSCLVIILPSVAAAAGAWLVHEVLPQQVFHLMYLPMAYAAAVVPMIYLSITTLRLVEFFGPREYLLWPLRLAFAISAILLVFNLTLAPEAYRATGTLLSDQANVFAYLMLVGAILLCGVFVITRLPKWWRYFVGFHAINGFVALYASRELLRSANSIQGAA